MRRRVRAVKSTQQITKAMKMIAASKLRRAQDRILGARPFANGMLRVLNRLAMRVDTSLHPLLQRPESHSDSRTLLFVITADKGLCGGFNTNIVRSATGFVNENSTNEVALGLIGRKGRDFFRPKGFDVCYENVNLFSSLSFSHAQAIREVAIKKFTTQAVNSVYLVYNEFKSILQQRVVVERLLPIADLEKKALEAGVPSDGTGSIDYLYEPTPEGIFDDLLPHHVEVQTFRALLESAAAEHAARMTAMDAATKNSGELIEQLTLHMNKVRQAAITREIIEVVSGAEAL
jgi:F-type H+-transporting ATPase subunit gamma